MKNIIILLIYFFTVITSNAAQQQLAIIPSFFSNIASIAAIKKTMDTIEANGLCYPDYSKRKGGIWTDFFVYTKQTERITECKHTVKLTEVDGRLQQHSPQSMCTYPHIQSIISQELLPRMFNEIQTKQWMQLPPLVFAQLFIQRCHTSEPMDWHQDPGEDFTVMADYSLIVMLSDQNDLEHGWLGGVFKIKLGLPDHDVAEQDIQTIIPQYNQAILFNNKLHSHAVTAITNDARLKTKRDLLVVPIYCNAEIPRPHEWR